MNVPCESTLRFASALRKCGVPFEMHIYEKGGHGMATGDKVTNNAVFRAKDWLAESAAWIADNRIAYIDEIKKGTKTIRPVNIRAAAY